MSAPIPSVEPTRAYCGTTIAWTKSFADYPPATWTLKYHFVGASNIVVTATTSGGEHLVTLTAANSEALSTGRYRLIGYVQDDASSPTERYVIYEGECELLLNPAFQANGQAQTEESRSFWRRVRDNLRNIIEGKSQQSLSTYNVLGRQVSKMTWPELMDAYDRASVLVKQEDEQEAVARGESTNRQIGILFRRPT